MAEEEVSADNLSSDGEPDCAKEVINENEPVISERGDENAQEDVTGSPAGGHTPALDEPSSNCSPPLIEAAPEEDAEPVPINDAERDTERQTPESEPILESNAQVEPETEGHSETGDVVANDSGPDADAEPESTLTTTVHLNRGESTDDVALDYDEEDAGDPSAVSEDKDKSLSEGEITESDGEIVDDSPPAKEKKKKPKPDLEEGELEDGEIEDSDEEDTAGRPVKERLPVNNERLVGRRSPYAAAGPSDWDPLGPPPLRRARKRRNRLPPIRRSPPRRFEIQREIPSVGAETPWERGLREARELMKRASQKKQEPDFEHKRLLLPPSDDYRPDSDEEDRLSARDRRDRGIPSLMELQCNSPPMRRMRKDRFPPGGYEVPKDMDMSRINLILRREEAAQSVPDEVRKTVQWRMRRSSSCSTWSSSEEPPNATSRTKKRTSRASRTSSISSVDSGVYRSNRDRVDERTMRGMKRNREKCVQQHKSDNEDLGPQCIYPNGKPAVPKPQMQRNRRPPMGMGGGGGPRGPPPMMMKNARSPSPPPRPDPISSAESSPRSRTRSPPPRRFSDVKGEGGLRGPIEDRPHDPWARRKRNSPARSARSRSGSRSSRPRSRTFSRSRSSGSSRSRSRSPRSRSPRRSPPTGDISSYRIPKKASGPGANRGGRDRRSPWREGQDMRNMGNRRGGPGPRENNGNNMGMRGGGNRGRQMNKPQQQRNNGNGGPNNRRGGFGGGNGHNNQRGGGGANNKTPPPVDLEPRGAEAISDDEVQMEAVSSASSRSSSASSSSRSSSSSSSSGSASSAASSRASSPALPAKYRLANPDPPPAAAAQPEKGKNRKRGLSSSDRGTPSRTPSPSNGGPMAKRKSRPRTPSASPPPPPPIEQQLRSVSPPAAEEREGRQRNKQKAAKGRDRDRPKTKEELLEELRLVNEQLRKKRAAATQ